MVERITDPHRPVSLRNCTGRLPDGEGVPQPPRPVPAGMSRSERIGWALAGALALVLMVAGITGTLR